MAWIRDEFSTIEELYREVMGHSLSDRLVAYRGQANASKPLQSSLDRILDPNMDYTDRLAEEQAVLTEFNTRAPEFLGANENSDLRQVLADNQLLAFTVLQHYGAPTRLLDWTRSPWVALYFAAVSDHDKDGAVWWFNQRAFEAEVHKAWAKHDMERFRRPREFGGEIDPNKTAFNVDGPAWITAWYSLLPFRRMEIQQGFFTVAGRLGLNHDDLIANTLIDPAPRVLVVPARLKKNALSLLRKMGIHAQSLDYPGADKVGQNLTRKLESRFPKKP